ncbi:MAG: phosphopyruvate hydratase [Candidatus Bipolaricaulota bacterium]
MARIREVHAREILDSRGNPTVETEIILEDGTWSRAAVPSGASTGKFEALELRDGDQNRYEGKGVQQAVQNVNEEIAIALDGMNPLWQEEIDDKLLELDGTQSKENLGANAVLSVSLAAARAAANSLGLPLFKYIAGAAPSRLPIPLMNVLNGGAHAANNLDLQEFMITPIGATSFSQAARMGSEVFHKLQSLLDQRGMSTAVGDEGGFAPDLDQESEALDLLVEAIETAGYQPGLDLAIALDPAASEFYEDGCYHVGGSSLSADDLIDLYAEWTEKYPLVSIEDGLDQQDWEGWKSLTERLGQDIQIVGDDLFVTDVERLQRGIDNGVANSILIKVNQIGTLTEAIQAVQRAHRAGYTAVISHRSGETEDVFIADLATGLMTTQLKSGSLSRSDRVAKYNQLLRLEDEYDLPLASWPL